MAKSDDKVVSLRPEPADVAIVDGLRLTKAFMLISDPAKRAKVIALAEELADKPTDQDQS